MRSLDIFWYIGITMCVVYGFLYAKDAMQLSAKKKKYTQAKGYIKKVGLVRKWAYTAYEVKYSFSLNGGKTEGFSSVQSILKAPFTMGTDTSVYYDASNPKENFLEDEIKTAWKNVLILVVMAIALASTLIFG